MADDLSPLGPQVSGQSVALPWKQVVISVLPRPRFALILSGRPCRNANFDC